MELLTVREASDKLHLSEKTTRKLIAAGGLEGIRVGDHKIFTTADAVQRYLLSRPSAAKVK